MKKISWLDVLAIGLIVLGLVCCAIIFLDMLGYCPWWFYAKA